MKLLIQGGWLADGSGEAIRKADVLVENDRISAVGPNLKAEDAQTVDAAGKIVCPAFVDIHRHLDAKPLLGSAMEVELRQGIATAVAGNCGFSLAPGFGPFAKEKHENDLPILGSYPADWQYTFADYMNALESSHPAINTAAMVGLGAVRICLNGFSNAPLTQSQLECGRDMIAEALSSGAAGVSAGIMYLPEFYTTQDEYRMLLSALKGGKKPLVTHIRGEGDSLVSSVAEVLQIAKDAECPLEISHFKSCGLQNWNREIHKAIELIEQARAEGQDVTVDFYPYLGGSTALTTMLPPAFVQGDMRRALERLGTRQGVKELRSACAIIYPDWDNYAITLGWDRILIASAEGDNQRFISLSVEEAAQKYGFEDSVALAAHLMHSENGRTAIINLSMDQRDVDTIARLEYANVISDSIYADTNNPHPRMYGAFPRFFEDFVRKRPIVSLETAIRKMTAQPADRMQLKGRGRIQEGCFADLLVFDEGALRSSATFSEPTHLGQGVSLLLVNGEVRVQHDALTGSSSGKVIRI